MRASLFFIGASILAYASAGVILHGRGTDSTASYPVIEEDIVEANKRSQDSTASYPVIEEDIVESKKKRSQDSTASYPVIEEDIVESK